MTYWNRLYIDCVRPPFQSPHEVVDRDVTDHVEQTEMVQARERRARGRVHHRRWVPTIPEQLLQIHSMVGCVASAVLNADIVDVLSIEHDHRSDLGCGTGTWVSTVS